MELVLVIIVMESGFHEIKKMSLKEAEALKVGSGIKKIEIHKKWSAL